MILDDARHVVDRSRHVRINRQALDDACAGLERDELRLPDWRLPVVPPWSDERLVDFFLLFNSINFCYWGQPKWAIDFRGASYDGAFGMMAALTRAIEDDGLPLLDGATLVGTGPELFGHILRGNVPIPLAAERLDIWHEVGRVLCREFGGRWHRVVERAGGSALRLVELLVTRFPSFEDTARFEGRRVAFRKRAQLAVGMTYQAFAGQGWGAFYDFDQLTVYADYKLPQVLRKLAILEYDRQLATRVDNQIILPAGSRMEVEIRAATVWACELMRQALLPRMPGLTAAHVDFWLWQTSQHKSPGDSPYHRTRTTAY